MMSALCVAKQANDVWGFVPLTRSRVDSHSHPHVFPCINTSSSIW